MSVKSVLQPYQVVTDGDMSDDVTSLETTVNYMDNSGYQVIWTGAPTGVFSVEVTINGTAWEALTFNPALSAPAGSGGSFVIDLNQLPFKQIRFVYTSTSGTGVLNVWTMAKRLGG